MPNRPTIALLCMLCLAIGSVVAQAQAQSHSISPQFATILQAQQHRDAVLDAAKHSTTWLRHDCPGASLAPLEGIKVWKWPEFDAAGVPIAGDWGESVQASGCGFTRVLNVVTTVRSPGALVTGPLAPGGTRADPILQRDASRYAFAAALLHSPGCKDAFLDDTEIDHNTDPRPPDAQLAGPARLERWSIVACGRSVAVEVQFLPTASGTTVVVHGL